MFSAFIFTCVVASTMAQPVWEVAQPSLGTIMWGIDTYEASEGLIAGVTNGPGNIIYRFYESGNALETLVGGTAPGQPFWPTCVCSATRNNSVVGGFGYGPNFPGSMFSVDSGYTYTPSTTSSNHWGLYLGCSNSLDNDAVILSGDWIVPGIGQQSGAGVSVDGGDVYNFNSWGVDHWARFASFINATHGFVSGGKYPVSSSLKRSIVLGDANHSSATAPLRSLSDKIAVVMEESEEEDARVNEDNDYQACITRTTNGGQTWQVVYETFGDVYLNQIKFVSPLVGFVAGENNRDGRSVILRTTDGGFTWNEVYRSTVSLVAMHFVNENVGWVGGADYSFGIKAFFAQTTDGGNTWAQVPSELPYSVWSMAGDLPDLVYAVAFNQATTGLLRYN